MSETRSSDEEEDDQSPRSKLLSSTLFDESVDVVDAEEVQSPTSEHSKVSGAHTFQDNAHISDHSNEQLQAGGSNALLMLGDQRSTPLHSMGGHGSDLSDNSDEDDDDDVDVQAAALDGIYDPTEYDHLPVTSEIKELFQYITRYTPQNIELDYKLRPFIPDYIPAVGDIDAFLNIPRPDGKKDDIGLSVLDEPCARQSEPAVLHLQLRALAKQTSAKAVLIKKVEGAEKNTKAIERWIRDISDLHRHKPPPVVHYTKPMPDIDNIMQEWPAEFEELLKEIGLPTADLNCDLPGYVDVVCSLFDIPTYTSKIQSLHVLFTLYSAIKNSQYFGESTEGSEIQEQS